ncbi:acyl-CoA dehydrogenase family protein [Streptomyces sp. NRRL S-813]|uniref:acyl-CoA dehydrogenase family protein n=1 Tax=Streptomyces sp. NRRL S-813 TaxID=1463919 RepID=UPI000AD30639|nr:acyl-CoA dehydrogenase [Streptomyces sp. NRRL S-813]
MPAFSLEPEQLAWCAELRTLAADRLRPLAEKGEPGRVNHALLAELGRLGLLERLFTSGALDLCLMRESLAYSCTEAETALALQGLGAHPVHAHGTPAQRDRWLPAVTDGSAVAAFALSEPGAGSDAAALGLRAEPEGAEGEGGGPPGSGRPPGSASAEGAARGTGAGRREGESGAAPLVEPGATPLAGSGDVRLTGPGGSPLAEPGGAPLVDPGAGPLGRPGGARPLAASGASPLAEPHRSPLAGTGTAPAAAASPPTARPEGPARWRLTGQKCWISNAPEADVYTVFARTTPGAGSRGITAFLVPADRPGLTGSALEMLSPHPIGTLDFDGVPVTADDVLGEVDRGFRVAMGTLNLFRPSVGAFAVGMAQAALDATLSHTARREAFGGTLNELQTVAHQVAEMALRTEAARLMVYAAATAYDDGAPDVPRRAAMAKLLATETAQYVVDTAVQLHGARALRRGHLLEHLYREVRAPRIYEGASEVQRSIIAKELYAMHARGEAE